MYNGSPFDVLCEEISREIDDLIYDILNTNELNVLKFKEIRKRATSLAAKVDDFRQKVVVATMQSNSKEEIWFAALRLEFLAKPLKEVPKAIESKDYLGPALSVIGLLSPLTSLITVSDKLEALSESLKEKSTE